MKQPTRKLIRSIAKTVVAVGALTILGVFAYRYNYELETVKAYLYTFNTLTATVIYTLLYFVVSVVPAPGARDTFKLVGPMRFGFLGSVLLVWIGEMLAAAISFPIGRWAGRDLLEQLFGARMIRLNERLKGANWQSIAFLRLLPVIPYRHFNFSAGLVDLRFGAYLLGSAVGILGRTAFFQFLFAVAMDYLIARGVTILQLYVVSVFLVPLMLGIFFLFGRKRKKDKTAREEREASSSAP
ncbi:MAG TPA: VTT domain-containing protein [bacterium]|nr:VTT domain-containing protein [bacterium]